MEGLIEELNTYCNLSEAEETLLRQTSRVLHFPKGSTVIGTGKIDDSLYVLRKGVWRAYCERDGEEQTLWFAIAGEIVFSSWGFSKGLPSRLTISSSSDSMAIELKKTTIDRLVKTSPGILQWILELYNNLLMGTDDLLVNISSPKAEERYLVFMKKMPEIFQNVPLKEIAGFIGVTPQSLSRIRAGLNKDKNK